MIADNDDEDTDYADLTELCRYVIPREWRCVKSLF